MTIIGKIPEGAILVTADLSYASISHEDLEALQKILSEIDSPKVPTEDIVGMEDFVLKNDIFEFNSEVQHRQYTFYMDSWRREAAQFLNELINNFHSNLEFIYDISSCNQQMVTSTFTISLLTSYTLRPQYHIMKH